VSIVESSNNERNLEHKIPAAENALSASTNVDVIVITGCTATSGQLHPVVPPMPALCSWQSESELHAAAAS